MAPLARRIREWPTSLKTPHPAKARRKRGSGQAVELRLLDFRLREVHRFIPGGALKNRRVCLRYCQTEEDKINEVLCRCGSGCSSLMVRLETPASEQSVRCSCLRLPGAFPCRFFDNVGHKAGRWRPDIFQNEHGA